MRSKFVNPRTRSRSECDAGTDIADPEFGLRQSNVTALGHVNGPYLFDVSSFVVWYFIDCVAIVDDDASVREATRSFLIVAWLSPSERSGRGGCVHRETARGHPGTWSRAAVFGRGGRRNRRTPSQSRSVLADGAQRAERGRDLIWRNHGGF